MADIEKLFVANIVRLLGKRKPAELASKSGLDPGYISKILSGEKANVQLATLAKIADALGATFDEMLTDPTAARNAVIGFLDRTLKEQRSQAKVKAGKP